MKDEYITLTGLKKNFYSRYNLSRDKVTFLSKEIEGVEILFDDKRPLSSDPYDFFIRPLLENYDINYNDYVIDLIRAAYKYFIVDGNDLSKSQEWADQHSEAYFEVKSSDVPVFFQLAKDLSEYLKWLKSFSEKTVISAHTKENQIYHPYMGPYGGDDFNYSQEGLISAFLKRHQNSKDKEALLKKEIGCYESIFDDSKLFIQDIQCNRPLLQYSLPFTDWDILIIREAYDYFIIEGNNISESERLLKKLNNWLIRKFEIGDIISIYNLTICLYEYLEWLRNFSNSKLEYFHHKLNAIERTFPEYLNISPDEKRNIFAERLKKEFSTESGKGIRFMIDVLIYKKIITIKKGQLKKLVNALNQYFETDIGTYESIRRTKYNPNNCDPIMYKTDFESTENKMDFILKDI